MAVRAKLSAGFSVGKLLVALRVRPLREFPVPVRRPDDFLVFDLLLDNLEVRPGAAPRLEKRNPAAAAHLIVEFPPQSFAEEAFVEASDAAGEEVPAKEVSDDPRYKPKNVSKPTQDLLPLPSSRVRMAGRSRLAFTMPPGVTSLPYTLAAVLEAMRTWPPSLSVNALPDPDPPPRWVREAGHRDWLGTAVVSSAWQATIAGLSSALETGGARGIDDALADAARRIAERGAGGLTGSARGALGRVMFETLHGEMEELVRRFPSLREGAAHEAALAALSLAATEALAPAAARAGFDVGLAAELPFFPLIFGPHEPAPHVTALELPYRLILSPIEQARWRHRDAPVAHRGRTELWHTRLSTAATDRGPDVPSKVRALWSPDYPQSPEALFPLLEPPLPFRNSLDALDRQMLVKLMAGYDEGIPGGPRASTAKRLHLSALGGLLDVEGNWDRRRRPGDVDLQQWRHLATLGRDHYVRVVYAGYLCPFGHSASLVKVTERKFESLAKDPKQRVAVLRQRFFIVCRERIKHYPGPGHEFGGRNFPFQQVEVLTRVTPDLLTPGAPGYSEVVPFPGDTIYGGPIARRMVFWPVLSSVSVTQGVDFRFEILATDITGRRACFSLPLLFVGEVANVQKSLEVQRAYNNAPPERRRASLGCTVCYAPYDPAAKGDTRLPTAAMAFAAGELITAPRKELPSFHPETAAASAGIPALQKMLGREVVAEVTYPEVYKQDGFGGANAGELFLRLFGKVYATYSKDKVPDAIKVDLKFTGRAVPLEFGGEGQAKSDALGALAAPQMSILALSRIMGPVAGKEPPPPAEPAAVEDALRNATGNRFEPADFFPPGLPKSAKILGGVDLGEILDSAGLAEDGAPKLLSRELPAIPGKPPRLEASFEWRGKVEKIDALKLLIPRADLLKDPTRLVMNSVVTTPLEKPAAGQQAASYETHAELNNFKVNLFGCIILWFERLHFSAKQGQKPDVAVELRQGSDAVQFGGPLEFVNTLRELIPSNGFSDPPSLAVTPSGITASYSLNLPSVEVGIFALSNASLGAGFDLPFDARPASVKFNFSERQQPFSLTVSLLGGGGFFAIGVSARGVQEIEAALEFGAALSIDLGVASGGVEIKAGVYFHWLEGAPGGSVELAGYVRIHGELSVLGIISVSLTFELKLGYLKEGGRSSVWGEASLIVEIEILFFSFDVTVRVRREFAGAASDPKFIDLVPDAATWTEYCDAFAEEAA